MNIVVLVLCAVFSSSAALFCAFVGVTLYKKNKKGVAAFEFVLAAINIVITLSYLKLLLG